MMRLPNYELIFNTIFWDDGVKQEFTRIIKAKNKVTAQLIGEAMLGEEVWARESLYELLIVKRTNKKVCLADYGDYHTWVRVIKNIDHKILAKILKFACS